MSQNINNPPPYTQEVTTHPNESEPVQNEIETNTSKPKIRTTIPFLFVDIDITDFPSISFIRN
jgi:hypothetical protein